MNTGLSALLGWSQWGHHTPEETRAQHAYTQFPITYDHGLWSTVATHRIGNSTAISPSAIGLITDTDILDSFGFTIAELWNNNIVQSMITPGAWVDFFSVGW